MPVKLRQYTSSRAPMGASDRILTSKCSISTVEMQSKARSYDGQCPERSAEPLFAGDYEKVREFLRSLNRDRLVYPGFSWGRWEWMTTHAMLNRTVLNRIG